MSTSSVLQALSALAPTSRSSADGDAEQLIWLGLTAPIRNYRQYFQPPVSIVDIDGSVSESSEHDLARLASRTALAGLQTVTVSFITIVGLDGTLTSSTTAGSNSDASLSNVPWLRALLVADARFRSLDEQATSAVRALELATPWRFNIGDETSLPRLERAGIPTPDTDLSLWGARQIGDESFQAWTAEVAASQGWELDATTTDHPIVVRERYVGHQRSRRTRVTFCVGHAILARAIATPGATGHALLEWSNLTDLDNTAFAALVAPDDRDEPNDEASDSPPADGSDASASQRSTDGDPVPAHVLLTTAQELVVDEARRARVTVVSGAPGTGKTHTISAVCADAVTHNESVLVLTRTIEATDVIAAQLARQPGPQPIRFGSLTATRSTTSEIERRLSAQPLPSAIAAETRDEFALITAEIDRHLAALTAAEAATSPSFRLLTLRRSTPTLFEPSVDLDEPELRSLLSRARHQRGWLGTGLLRDRRRARAVERLRTRCGAADSIDLDTIEAALDLAIASRRGVDAPDEAHALQTLWPAWLRSDALIRRLAGEELDRNTIDRLSSRRARGALSTVQTALRSGPSACRRLLASLSRSDFRHGAPIWLGTLGDVERLLPAEPEWFDLVVIDEASQVDLILAAPALLRAKRCVIIGDPRQLRPVSFVSDEAITEAFGLAGIPDEIGRLNLRRNSLFDIAASVSPVRWLDEHFRSLPHLIGFSLGEFYDRQVHLATRHPSTETRSCISVFPQGPDPIRTVIDRIEALAASGVRDIGVVTPFRPLADQLQEEIIRRIGLASITEWNLMATTVHGFQGAERKHMIVLMGLDADGPANRRRFVEDPNLFNVMVSRARQRMDVFCDVAPDETTLLGRFLTWANQPDGHRWLDADGAGRAGGAGGAADSAGGVLDAVDLAASSRSTASSRLAVALCDALVDAGVDAEIGYRVGSHTLDLVAHHQGVAIGIICSPHPDGPAAHRARHRALAAADWRLIDVAAPMDGAELVSFAISLASVLRA